MFGATTGLCSYWHVQGGEWEHETAYTQTASMIQVDYALNNFINLDALVESVVIPTRTTLLNVTADAKHTVFSNLHAATSRHQRMALLINSGLTTQLDHVDCSTAFSSGCWQGSDTVITNNGGDVRVDGPSPIVKGNLTINGSIPQNVLWHDQDPYGFETTSQPFVAGRVTNTTDLPAFDNYVAIQLTPVVFLHMGEGSGNAADFSGNGNNGVATATITYSEPSLVTDGEHTSVLLDGVAGSYTVASSGTMVGGDTFTWGVVVRNQDLTGTRNSYVLAQKTSGAGVIVNAGAVSLVQIGTSGPIETGNVGILDTTSAHLIVVTKNGASTHIYLDGNDISSPGVNQTIAPADATWYVGSGGGAGTAWLGYISDAFQTGTVMTPAQVKSLYSIMVTAKNSARAFVTSTGCIHEYNNGWAPGYCGRSAIAALPTCNSFRDGGWAWVLDAVACVDGSLPVAGGGQHCPVDCGNNVWHARYNQTATPTPTATATRTPTPTPSQGRRQRARFVIWLREIAQDMIDLQFRT